MYIRPKRFFWSIVALLAALYAGAHFLARSQWGAAQLLRGISAATGYAASASGVRLTPCLALSLDGFRLDSISADGAATNTVVSAPFVRIARCHRGGWCVRAVRADLHAWLGPDGVWTPSQATGVSISPGEKPFSAISPAFGRLYFDVSDSSVSFHVSPSAEPDCWAGVSWTRRPVRIPGRGGTVLNRISWLKGPTEISTGSDEWFETSAGLARLQIESAGPIPTPEAVVATPVASPIAASPDAAAEPDAAPEEALITETVADPSDTPPVSNPAPTLDQDDLQASVETPEDTANTAAEDGGDTQ